MYAIHISMVVCLPYKASSIALPLEIDVSKFIMDVTVTSSLKRQSEVYLSPTV